MAQELEKITIRVQKGAKEKLQEFFPNVPYNVVIRALIGNFVKGVEEKVSRDTSNRNIAVTTSLGDIDDLTNEPHS